MRLLEALKIVQEHRVSEAEPFRVYLAFGFEPLHLATFLCAHLQLAAPNRRVEILTGRYGDLQGNIARAGQERVDACLTVIEWPDLDPRLGLRQLGGWSPDTEADIVAEAARRLTAIENSLTTAHGSRVVCCMPTLPMPPFAHTAPWQASSAEIQLRELISSFSSRLQSHARLLNIQELDRLSPCDSRHDVSSDLNTGFPYSLAHADGLAALLSKLVLPRQPKKALITDLDDCIWSGIVGEVGIDGVHWDLDRHSQIHGLYQQFLRSIAEAGVLVGVASRNDPKQVERAFQRQDLLIRPEHLFPIEAHWRRKSESVERIVQQWNIGYDSVVFVDDSPMELAEVKAAFPEVECLLFPASDPGAAYALLHRLRELFGKERILEEDRIRATSLRPAALRLGHGASAIANSNGASNGKSNSNRHFLELADAELTFIRMAPPGDPRALELVNKTNQFNLNGKRYDESSWTRRVGDPTSVHLLTAYRDRFGPLGKIAVLSGHLQDRTLAIDTWVMSCRAFGRQIEHEALNFVFDRFGISAIEFDFAPTERNGPVQELLRHYVDELPNGRISISRDLFLSKCPNLCHKVKECASE
jgi:FkbH-like protein